MSNEAFAALAEGGEDASIDVELPKSRLVETALTVLFTAAAVFFVSFLVVMTGIV
jgi:hypothetical protein